MDVEKCRRNLGWNRNLVDGKSVEQRVLLDITDDERFNKMLGKNFICHLKDRCGRLGVHMDDPLIHQRASMSRFSSMQGLENLLRDVVEKPA